MSHNHIIASSQQHTMNTNSVGVQQRNIIAQRGSAAVVQTKSTFQVQAVPIAQLSHIQQLYSQKQLSSDISSQIQNGNLTIENTVQHQYQQSPQQQPSVQQHIYQQAPQPKHHIHHPVQHLLQQPQLPQHLSSTHYQPIQHISQRNPSQAHSKHHPQPKQILHHPPVTKNVSSPAQKSSQPPSSHAQSSQPSKASATNGQPGLVEIKNDNEKSDAKLVEKQDKNNAAEMLSLANTKEKTPMCLINELARFNKISHQYTLVDEQGPAHKKTFYVKLKLGDEEYNASGESIKKAQHAAAAIALNNTKHQQPPPKPSRHSGGSSNEESEDEKITPTVELNALAMKRGEAAVYKAIEPQQPPYFQPGMDYRGLYNQRYQQYMRANRNSRYRGGGVLWPLRYQYPRLNRAFYVSLRVGHREFIGDGPTRQAARHNAAQKALHILKNLPVPNEPKKEEQPEVEVTETSELSSVDSLKSEISLVHEIALRRNMLVNFEVIREAGPPHMKNFITRCSVGEHVTEGEGNSKKASKKKAAELMLEELRKLPPAPAPTFTRPRSKSQINKKKNRNLIKSELQSQKADPNYGVGINPISRLIQIMQAQKKKEPVYTLLVERGVPRRREFIMQVDVEDEYCTGYGPNKKLAKRSAAEAMLQLLGYTKPSPQPAKSSFKHPASGEGNQNNGDKKVTFVDSDVSSDNAEKISSPTVTTPHHQRVPGLLHLPNPKLSVNPSAVQSPANTHVGLVNLANILQPNLRPEIQLRELSKALNLELEIDDFTKKRPTGTEHITRITVGTDPGQNFHGNGNTMESSRDMAAMDALRVLLAKVKDIHPGGDGPQVKKDLLARSSTALKKNIPK